MNAQMNPQQLQQTLQNFERESAKMDLSEEISKSIIAQYNQFWSCIHLVSVPDTIKNINK